jgi:hypothetical protein
MGVPTSEVGYTSATTGRGDYEVHKRHVVALGKNHTRTVKPYDIFKGKNALVNSVCYVTASIILSLVPHTIWHNSVRRMAGRVSVVCITSFRFQPELSGFLCSSESLHGLRGPTVLLVTGYGGLFRRGKDGLDVKQTTLLYPLPRLRTYIAAPFLTDMPSNFLLTFLFFCQLYVGPATLKLCCLKTISEHEKCVSSLMKQSALRSSVG